MVGERYNSLEFYGDCNLTLKNAAAFVIEFVQLTIPFNGIAVLVSTGVQLVAARFVDISKTAA